MIHECANGADRGDVVVTDQRGEIAASLDQFVCRFVTQFWSGDPKLELHYELRRDLEFEIAGNIHQALPAIVGIGTVAASPHEGDFSVSKLIEMAKRQVCSAFLVENDAGHTFDLLVACDSYGRKRSNALLQRCIDKDEAFDGAVHEKARILLDEVGLTAMTGRQIEVTLFDQMFFDAAQNLRCVTVAKFGYEHAYCEGLAFSQRTGEEAGPVVELGGGLYDTVSSVLRDGTHAGSIIQDQRYGGWRKVEILTQRPQTDGLSWLRSRCWFSSLGHALML